MEHGEAQIESRHLRIISHPWGGDGDLFSAVALRRASRKDANQDRIVKALREVGVRVYILNEPVDLLTGHQGVLRALEVKDGERVPSQRKLKPSQEKFMAEFQGCPVFKVENVFEALAAHGIEIQG